jgi:uncharacterized repeat protein (TIGR03803 family)
MKTSMKTLIVLLLTSTAAFSQSWVQDEYPGEPAQTFATLHSFDVTDGAVPWGALLQATDGNFYGTAYGSGAGATPTATSTGNIKSSNTLASPNVGIQVVSESCFASSLVDTLTLSTSSCPLNITGATALVATVWMGTGNSTVTFADSCGSGNTWHVAVTTFPPGGGEGDLAVYIWYAYGLTTCTNDVFTETITSGSAGIMGIHVWALSGTPTTSSVLGPTNSSYTYGTSGQTGSVTPPQTGDFIVTNYTNNGDTVMSSVTVNSGFAANLTTAGVGVDNVVALADSYQIDVAGSALDPTWTTSATDWVTTAIAVFEHLAPAQGFATLHAFDNTHGANPYAGLVQGTDGNLYGTTTNGGANGYGTVFRIPPAAAQPTAQGGPNAVGTVPIITQGEPFAMLHSFCSQSDCPDGANPYAGLVQDTNGNFYGITYYGGANREGTVFKITPSGTLTTLYSFCSQSECTDGDQPHAGLVQGTDGNLYGTTYYGGANGQGTVFKITPSGTLTTLYSFCSQSGCTDGDDPYAGLVQAADGNFYGTTVSGGANNDGTVFKITPSGTLTTLYSFCSQSGCTDGDQPYAGLVQGTDGNLYGTTYYGGAGAYESECPDSEGCGTVFKITPGEPPTTLYSFCSQSGCTDGAGPYAGLVQATDGNLYGTTYYGGASDACDGGCGTVFKISRSGLLTTLHSFDYTDGNEPYAGLVQDTNGNFYGTTSGAGAHGYGTVFSESVGLPPFVKTQPTSGMVGEAVKILGANLTGATGVIFHGHWAAFKVVSSSLITTTVPAGATTGPVEVVTPSRTLFSNMPFQVPPSMSLMSPGGKGR